MIILLAEILVINNSASHNQTTEKVPVATNLPPRVLSYSSPGARERERGAWSRGELPAFALVLHK